MKRTTRTLLPLLSAFLLTACAGTNTNPQETPVTEPPESASADTSFDAEDLHFNTVPLLAIETENQAGNVLDFVTKPVAEHVSEQIASWTPNYKIPPAPYSERCTVTLTDKDETTQLLCAAADVKVRGNWTTNYPKKPLRIKFDEKQSMLGLNDGNAFRNWLLLACYKDASLLRDKTALQAARELLGPDGLYAADAEFVEVTINGEYWGLYLLTEMQQVNPDRVDITEPEADYAGTDIGYFLEFDGYFYNEDPLHQFHVEYADNAPLTPYDGEGGSGKTITCLPGKMFDQKKDVGFTIKSDIYSQQQHDFIAAYVDNVYRVMYAAAYEDTAYRISADGQKLVADPSMTPQEAVEAVVNVQSLADMYIISELTCDADIYWSSFFMSADFGAEGDHRLTFQAPWDFDSGLGNKDRCADGKGFYAGNIVPDVNGDTYTTVNPWLAVLMYEDWYQAIIRETWTKAYDNGVFAHAAETLAADKSAYADAFVRNEERWGVSTKDDSVASELSPAAKYCKNQAVSANQLADWLNARIEFMNEHWHA